MRYRHDDGPLAGAASPSLLTLARAPATGERAQRGPLAGAAATILAGLLALVVISAAIGSAAGFDWRFAPAAIVVYGAIAIIALTGLRYHPHRRFGAPNIVTTVRAVATALFAGVLIEAERLDREPFEAWTWGFAAIALFALILDGVDGYLARRLSLVSPYGARYDMEVDALLILLLSALAYGLGKAGVFVLAIGLMRYAFVGAQLVLPWLAAELPASFRRKAICVLQAAALGAMITPIVQPPWSQTLAAFTVALLVWSFAVDVVWLARRRHIAA